MHLLFHELLDLLCEHLLDLLLFLQLVCNFRNLVFQVFLVDVQVKDHVKESLKSEASCLDALETLEVQRFSSLLHIYYLQAFKELVDAAVHIVQSGIKTF